MIKFYNSTDFHPSLTKIRKLVKKLFQYFKLPSEYTIEIILVDLSTIKKLNKKFLNHDYSTDVLSFPLDNSCLTQNSLPSLLGTIYLCPEYIQNQDGGVFDWEPYIIHGFIHLMNHDHTTSLQKKRWLIIQDSINQLLQQVQ